MLVILVYGVDHLRASRTDEISTPLAAPTPQDVKSAYTDATDGDHPFLHSSTPAKHLKICSLIWDKDRLDRSENPRGRAKYCARCHANGLRLFHSIFVSLILGRD